MMRNHHSDRAESRSNESNPSHEGHQHHVHEGRRGRSVEGRSFEGRGRRHGHPHGRRHEGQRPEGQRFEGRRERFGASMSDPFVATTRQVVDAARVVRQGSNEAQIAAAQEVLSQARRSLYLILAEEPKAEPVVDTVAAPAPESEQAPVA